MLPDEELDGNFDEMSYVSVLVVRHEWSVAVEEWVPLADGESCEPGIEPHQADVGLLQDHVGIRVPNVPARTGKQPSVAAK